MTAALNNCDEVSPYLLENEGAYQAWRERKLKSRQDLTANRVFELDHDGLLPRSMLDQLRLQVSAFNFVIFQSTGEIGKPEFLALNRQFGLQQLDINLGADADKVTCLRVLDE
jgi:hypothetical protein